MLSKNFMKLVVKMKEDDYEKYPSARGHHFFGPSIYFCGCGIRVTFDVRDHRGRAGANCDSNSIEFI
jgi:hypothetical protein